MPKTDALQYDFQPDDSSSDDVHLAGLHSCASDTLDSNVSNSSTNRLNKPTTESTNGITVSLRPYPYPYRSMFAICSDLDLTPNKQAYYTIAHYLNTTHDTPMGPGVGLEIGNTIYFDMPPDQFAYWNTDDAGRAMVRDMIHSGHIDAIHSYGDLATSRHQAGRALEELDKHDCRLQVWVDHSKAPSNFGPDIMVGSGDVTGMDVYHADLTLEYGIKYIWRGRTTGVTGQNTHIGIGGFLHFLDPRHPVRSMRTMTKEAVKVFLGRRGHPRWEMYGDNRVCRPHRLRDGQPIWEFLRSNPYWAGSGCGDTGDKIGDVLNQRMLDRLRDCGGACVLYTHLGKVNNPDIPFHEQACRGFQRLADMHHRGDLLVTTTYRLLHFMAVRDALRYSVRHCGDSIIISLVLIDDPVSGTRTPTMDDVQGMTFIVSGRHSIEIMLHENPIHECSTVYLDGKTYASINWKPLVFPAP